MKICRCCERELPEGKFPPMRRVCMACRSRQGRERRPKVATKPPATLRGKDPDVLDVMKQRWYLGLT